MEKGWASARRQRHLATEFKALPSSLCCCYRLRGRRADIAASAVIGVIKQTRRIQHTTGDGGTTHNNNNNTDNANKRRTVRLFLFLFLSPPKINNAVVENCTSAASNRLGEGLGHSSSTMLIAAITRRSAHIVWALVARWASDCCARPVASFIRKINFPSWHLTDPQNISHSRRNCLLYF